MITTPFGLVVALPTLFTASVCVLIWWLNGWTTKNGFIGSDVIDALTRVNLGLFVLWAVMR